MVRQDRVSPQQLTELIAAQEALHAVLLREHEQRAQRTDWLPQELAAMHAAVNRERHRQRRSLVTLAAVEAADRLAAGHVDYAAKFVLYCAELACGLRGPR